MLLIGSILVILCAKIHEDRNATTKVNPNIMRIDNGLNENTEDEPSIFEMVNIEKNVKPNSSTEDKVNEINEDRKL